MIAILTIITIFYIIPWIMSYKFYQGIHLGKGIYIEFEPIFKTYYDFKGGAFCINGFYIGIFEDGDFFIKLGNINIQRERW